MNYKVYKLQYLSSKCTNINLFNLKHLHQKTDVDTKKLKNLDEGLAKIRLIEENRRKGDYNES